jgi:hypothetical protein
MPTARDMGTGPFTGKTTADEVLRRDAARNPGPQPEPAARPVVTLPPPVRSVRFFVASLLFALTFGAGLGACLLGSMTLPWNFLHGLSAGAVRTAHGYAQVFGFATLFVMGVAYHVVTRFRGVPLLAPRLATASLWLQIGGVLAVAIGALVSEPISFPAHGAGATALLGAALAFGWNIHGTLASGETPHEPSDSYLRAGCGWLVVAGALGLATALSGRVALQAVMWESALWGFLGSWLFGMSLRIFPVFMGLASVRPRTARVLGIAYESAVAVWVTAALIDVWTTVPLARALAGAALTLTACMLVLQIGALGPREAGAADAGGYAKFIVAAYAWVLLALLFAPGWTAVAALGGAGVPALLFDFGRHAFTLGFMTQMIVGVATRIVPVFTGAPLWSAKLRDTIFVLLNAAVAARGLQVIVELAGTDTVWPYISLSGFFGFGAFAGFALNVFMTIRARPAGPPVVAQPAR